jgi:hypothetical protein
MSIDDCETCRAVHDLTGTRLTREKRKLPPILEDASVKAPPLTSAHVQKLVKLRRAYEAGSKEGTIGGKVANKDDKTFGIVAGLQLAIDSLSHDLGVTVDEPRRQGALPPRLPSPRRHQVNGASPDEPKDDDESKDDDDRALSKLQATLLGVLAGADEPITLTQLMIMSLYAPSGEVTKALARLRARELMDGNGATNWATPEGRSAVPKITRTRPELLAAWLKKLKTLDARLLEASIALAETEEAQVSTGKLIEASGYASSGAVTKALARLRRRGFILKRTNLPNPIFLNSLSENA